MNMLIRFQDTGQDFLEWIIAPDGDGEYYLKHAVASIVETTRIDFYEHTVAS